MSSGELQHVMHALLPYTDPTSKAIAEQAPLPNTYLILYNAQKLGFSIKPRYNFYLRKTIFTLLMSAFGSFKLRYFRAQIRARPTPTIIRKQNNFPTWRSHATLWSPSYSSACIPTLCRPHNA